MKNITIVCIYIILFILIVSFTANGASISSISGNMKPIIVLIERDPWLMVIGSDSPIFALYNNGILIYLEKAKGYFYTKLNKEQIKKFIPEKSFKNLKPYYSSSNTTDQITNSIFYWENKKKYPVSVYGNLRKSKEDRYRKSTPKEFLNIYDKLCFYYTIRKICYKGNKWLPKYIEVIIWPFEYSKETPVKWPSKWPNIKDPMTKKRGKDSYSIYLDSKYLNDLIKFLKNMKQTQAVLINSKKWAISYRYPFPKEEMWMK